MQNEKRKKRYTDLTVGGDGWQVDKVQVGAMISEYNNLLNAKFYFIENGITNKLSPVELAEAEMKLAKMTATLKIIDAKINYFVFGMDDDAMVEGEVEAMSLLDYAERKYAVINEREMAELRAVVKKQRERIRILLHNAE